jgi:hypothetical protein
MKRTLILVPASIVVVAGVVAALWALGSASGERAKFSSLEVAPAQADVFFAVNTDPTSPQWLAVNDSLDSLNAKDPIREAIDEALADVNLEWDRDIAPVAGDEAFFSVPDITAIENDGGWTAGVLLSDPEHAQEVFQQLRERNDSPPMTQEDYNGVAIWTTDIEGESSALGGPAPAFMQVTPTPTPDDSTETPRPSETPRPDCIQISVDEFGQETEEPCDEPIDGFFTPVFDCGGFGYNPDGTPNEEAFGGEPCESDAQYCLWWGFVPTGDDAEPYTTEPCAGTSSFCGNYGLLPTETPSANGLPCGDNFDFWFQEPVFEDDPIFDDGEYDIFEDDGDILADSTPSTTAIAFVDNVMALGGSADDVKSVIDVVQGRADSAVTNERLQEFRAEQKEDFLVWGYVDLADVWAAAEDSLSSPTYGEVDTKELFDQMRSTYDRVGFSVSSFSDGFGFDLTVVHSDDFDQDNAFEPGTPYDPAIAEVLPDDTLFYLSMFDLYNQSWLPAKEQWEDLDLGEDGSIQDILDDVEDETGIDLESDVFALLTGEIAIAGNVKDGETSLFGIADVADTAKARETIEELEAYLEGEDILEVDVDGDIHVWQGDEPEDEAAWYIDNGRVVAGFPAESVQDLADSEGGRLADNPDWQRTLDLLPDDKTFVGFLSIARILEEYGQSETGDQFEDATDGKVTLDDLTVIRSLGMSGTSSENGFGVHFVLFMKDE